MHRSAPRARGKGGGGIAGGVGVHDCASLIQRPAHHIPHVGMISAWHACVFTNCRSARWSKTRLAMAVAATPCSLATTRIQHPSGVRRPLSCPPRCHPSWRKRHQSRKSRSQNRQRRQKESGHHSQPPSWQLHCPSSWLQTLAESISGSQHVHRLQRPRR